MPPNSRSISLLASAALAVGVLGVVSASAGSAASDTQSTATAHLRADASGAVEFKAEPGGTLHFVGTAAGAEIRNPQVTSGMSASKAADADIARYGAALGTNRPGVTLVQRSARPTAVGAVVHYTQRVGGLPVIGGDVVVTLA